MIKFFEKHWRLSWFITILGAVGIFYVSSLSFPPAVPGVAPNLLPIIYHISAFFLFSLFLMISLLKGKKKYLILVFGILISIFYAITDELHQFFVPGRTSGFFDVFLDCVGILFAFMIYLIRLEIEK